MTIDFSSWAPVQGNEFVHKVFTCLLPTGGIALEIAKPEFGDGTRR